MWGRVELGIVGVGSLWCQPVGDLLNVQGGGGAKGVGKLRDGPINGPGSVMAWGSIIFITSFAVRSALTGTLAEYLLDLLPHPATAAAA
jgi:hypothetical protein